MSANPPLVLPPVVQVYPDAEALAAAAAERMARILAAAIAERGAASLSLSGGSTPGPAYRRLAEITAGGLDGAGVFFEVGTLWVAELAGFFCGFALCFLLAPGEWARMRAGLRRR